jgi:hypothetical protein
MKIGKSGGPGWPVALAIPINPDALLEPFEKRLSALLTR